MSQWYIQYNGQQVGPMTKEQLAHYGLNPKSKVWKEGFPQWVDAFTIPELMELMPKGPAPMNNNVSRCPEVGTSDKSKTTAGILALLLGGFGAQYYYVGKIGGGLVCFLLCLVTCGIWGILIFVQGIMMLTMSQEEFDRKFVYSDSFMPLF